jgi:kynurenine formamidase
MIHAEIAIDGLLYKADLRHPLDISIPLNDRASNPRAFYISPPSFQPVRVGGFVGSVAEGGSCNCEDLFINAHGNGTHTECVGHISSERYSIHECLKMFHFSARLISVCPDTIANGDNVITKKLIEPLLGDEFTDAIIIRTLPNGLIKTTADYSGSNPCYFDAETLTFLREQGFKHLLTDLPSVDREEDGGVLAAHHAWWSYPHAPRYDATITEMIFVPNTIVDGLYLLNIQIASIMSDASPSKPVLYILDQSRVIL